MSTVKRFYGRYCDLVDPYHVADSKFISDMRAQSTHSKTFIYRFLYLIFTDLFHRWHMYFNSQVMLTTHEHLITPLFEGPCLGTKYYRTDLRVRTYEFEYFDHFTLRLRHVSEICTSPMLHVNFGDCVHCLALNSMNSAKCYVAPALCLHIRNSMKASV